MNKRNYATTYRGDIRKLATIARFMISKNQNPKSLAEVVRFSVNSMALMVQEAKGLNFRDVSDAVEFLNSLGIFDSSGEFRNKTTLIKDLNLETLSTPVVTSTGPTPEELQRTIQETMERINKR